MKNSEDKPNIKETIDSIISSKPVKIILIGLGIIAVGYSTIYVMNFMTQFVTSYKDLQKAIKS